MPRALSAPLAALTAALLLSAAFGCASSQTGSTAAGGTGKLSEVQEKVMTQAAFDLQCDRAQLQLSRISDDGGMMGVKNETYGVRGCEKQATYKTSCGMGQCSVFNMAQAQATTPQKM
ncbi:MAG: hypothetical protein U1A78_05965 [Polyangia bacterium]